jgi:hypothetical protein
MKTLLATEDTEDTEKGLRFSSVPSVNSVAYGFDFV